MSESGLGSSYDNMAIDANQIDNMKSAIEKYTVDVENHLNKISKNDITVGDGVYGAAQIKMVNDYIDNTCKQIKTIVRYFDDFKGKLDVVKEQYEKEQGKVSMGTVETAKEANESEMVTVNRIE